MVNSGRIVAALLLAAVPASAQFDHAWVDEAERALAAKQYLAAARLYEAAIESGDRSDDWYLGAARGYALTGKVGEAMRDLGGAVDHGYRDLAALETNAEFSPLHTQPGWKPLVAKLKTKLARMDPMLRDELKAMVRADQELVRCVGADPSSQPELQAVQLRNRVRLQEIIAEHGWPGESLVGIDGAGAAWIIVQHSDDDIPFQEWSLALMAEAMKEGEASEQLYAYLVDRVRANQERKQLYGTQFETRDGELVPRPIEDPALVDRRRHQVGLPPLAEYQRMMRQAFAPEPAKSR